MKPELNIRKLAIENLAFRKVIQTGKSSQLVLMSIPRDESIGEEIHPQTDQLFFIVEGKGEAIIENKPTILEEGQVLFVPAGVRHDIKNALKGRDLKLFTLYTPPIHPDGLVQQAHETLVSKKAY